jgi:uncharacterized protein YraI
MSLKHLSLAAGLLIASAGAAAAAPAAVTGDLNLRSGPGTGYAVVGTMPAGATVDVRDCNGAWCRVAWGNAVGFASRSYLDVGGPVYAAAPPPVVVGPPVFGFGVGWGGGWHRGWHGGGWHHGWHGGGHWHHR